MEDFRKSLNSQLNRTLAKQSLVRRCCICKRVELGKPGKGRIIEPPTDLEDQLTEGIYEVSDGILSTACAQKMYPGDLELIEMGSPHSYQSCETSEPFRKI